MQKHIFNIQDILSQLKNKVPRFLTTNNPSEETLVKCTIKNLTAVITVINS